MITRKKETDMRDFFLHDNRALLVEGARQTGKTFSIRRVGKECFDTFVEINFYEQPDALALFANFTSAKDILMRLSTLTKKELKPGKTLIFFDEVQECREIVTAVKFLVDEGSFRYVLSGSLLGVELKDIKSVPVGYLKVMQMYPLDMEEFAEAIGIGRNVIDSLRQSYNTHTAVDSYIHERMLEMTRLYLIIGGMPAAVQKFIDSNNLRRVAEIQRDIVALYRRDISKYDPGHKLNIEEIFDLIPSELNAKNKRFILKNLNEKARFSRYEDSFLWLKDAGVAIPTYNVEEPRIPLLLSKQRNLFKLFLNDVGLLASMYAGDIQQLLLRNETTINNGSIYENLVAQELYAHGLAGYSNSLYYFNSKKQGELDFVVEYEGSILPIEVKSGKDYHRHNALSGVMSNQEYSIPRAFTLCQGNVEAVGNVVYLPIYMVIFIQHNTRRAGNDTYKFDLTGLA